MQIFKITTLYKFIYVGVIIFLLFSYFRAKEVTSYNLDGLGIIETSSIEYPIIPKRIKSLELNYKGLSCIISNRTPLIIKSDDNITRYSKVKKIQLVKQSLQITLDNQIELNFRVDNNGQRLTIGSNIPKVFPTINEIILPFTLSNNYSMTKTDLSYEISNGNEEFHLKLNDNYYVNESKDKIHMVAQDDKISTLTFSPLSSSDLPLAEQWYMSNRQITTAPIEDTIAEYLDKVEKNVNSIFNPIRLITDSNIWQNVPQKKNITENAIITYLSQAMKNGRYQRSLEKIEPIKAKYPDIFTYASTPFMGNIIQNGNKGMTDYKKELSKIQSLIRSSDPSLFKIRIPEHLFEANELDTNKLTNLINNVDKKTLSIEELSIALNNLIHILERQPSSARSSDSVKEITDLILQKLNWDDSGSYLVNSDSLSDQKLNLITGQLLIEASQYETSEYSKPVGEGLVRTFLNNSDKDGNVKTLYSIKSKIFSDVNIMPEDSFLLLSDNQYIPHYFYSEGITIWTISDSIVIDKSTKDIRITITYPVDYNSVINSHFLTISGVNPYKQLYFKGKLWRADKVFERYGVGYYYEYSSKLLYFMPNHSKPREEIVITY